MDYLAEAAELLRKAASTNEKEYGPAGRVSVARHLNEGRERIAVKFALLAAIEQGLLPAEMIAPLIAELTDSGKS
jgi:hypothetical protein